MADEPAKDPRAAGWKKDPSGRFYGRFWDGEKWTEHVVSAERVRSVDPIPRRPATPVQPTQRLETQQLAAPQPAPTLQMPPAATRQVRLMAPQPPAPILERGPGVIEHLMGWPRWAKWTAGIFAALLIIGAVFGEDPDDDGVRTVVGDEGPVTTTTAETPTTPTTAAATTLTTTTVIVTTTGAPAAITLPAMSSPAPTSPPATTDAPRSVYYANCSAVRAAGAAPIYLGEPGYGSHLDRDDDGVACET